MGKYDSLHERLDKGDGTMLEAFRYYENCLRSPDYENFSKELKKIKDKPSIFEICLATVFLPVLPQIISLLMLDEDLPVVLSLINKYIFFAVLALQVLAIIIFLIGFFIDFIDDSCHLLDKTIGSTYTYNKKRSELENKYKLFYFSDRELRSFALHKKGYKCDYNGNCCLDGHRPTSDESKHCGSICSSCPAFQRYQNNLVSKIVHEKNQ